MVVVATQYRCLVLYFLHNPKFGLSLDNGYQDLLAIFTHHDLDLPVTNPAFLLYTPGRPTMLTALLVCFL